MEKYRKFGDASTGIHPFTVVIAPKAWGVAAASVMFPCRLLFCTLFSLLLILTDVLVYLVYVLFLSFIGRWLLAPLQRLWLRALLFFAGHLLVSAEAVEGDHMTAARRARMAAMGSVPSATSAAASLRAGDVVFVNMQSVWDIYALEVGLATPYYVAVFPTGAGLKVMYPGPFQRWAVWAHVRKTGTLAFVKSLAASSATAAATAATEPPSSSSSSLSAADSLAALQATCRVPIFYFAEGTCENGKGILHFSPVTLLENHKVRAVAVPTAARKKKKSKHSSDSEDSDDDGHGTAATQPPAVAAAAITYNTPAVQNVVSEGEGFFSYLFRVSKLMYGSTAPAWSSPFFPTALVQIRRSVPLDGARKCVDGEGAEGVHGDRSGSAHEETVRAAYVLTTAAVDSLRDAMCMKGGGGRVASAGAGGVRRQPLNVGAAEKLGFIETYMAANGLTPAS